MVDFVVARYKRLGKCIQTAGMRSPKLSMNRTMERESLDKPVIFTANQAGFFHFLRLWPRGFSQTPSLPYSPRSVAIAPMASVAARICATFDLFLAARAARRGKSKTSRAISAAPGSCICLFHRTLYRKCGAMRHHSLLTLSTYVNYTRAVSHLRC